MTSMLKQKWRLSAATLAAAAAACLPSTALAQSEGPIDVEIEGRPDGPGDGPPPDENRFSIGVGGMYAPGYLGSSRYKFQPLPAVDIKYDRFFVNFQDGIGANLIDGEAFTIGAGLVMADGYSEKDAPRGIGKLSTGLGARGFVKLRQAGFEATLGATKILTGSTKGFVADASIQYPIFASSKFILVPSVGTNYGDRKHNNRYFGVTAAQSIASGLPQFTGKSGFIDVKAELMAQYFVTDRISFGLLGGVSSLIGDVKNSPIVESRTKPYTLGFISYSF